MENTKGIEQKCKYFRITTFVGFVCEELPKQWCCTTMENNASLDKLLTQQTFIEHELWSSHTVLYKERTYMTTFLPLKNSQLWGSDLLHLELCPSSSLRSPWPQLLSKSSGVSSCQRVFWFNFQESYRLL